MRGQCANQRIWSETGPEDLPFQDRRSARPASIGGVSLRGAPGTFCGWRSLAATGGSGLRVRFRPPITDPEPSVAGWPFPTSLVAAEAHVLETDCRGKQGADSYLWDALWPQAEARASPTERKAEPSGKENAQAQRAGQVTMRLLQDELEELARGGESERVEFKPSARQKDEIRDAICAFANDLS